MNISKINNTNFSGYYSHGYGADDNFRPKAPSGYGPPDKPVNGFGYPMDKPHPHKPYSDYGYRDTFHKKPKPKPMRMQDYKKLIPAEEQISIRKKLDDKAKEIRTGFKGDFVQEIVSIFDKFI